MGDASTKCAELAHHLLVKRNINIGVWTSLSREWFIKWLNRIPEDSQSILQALGRDKTPYTAGEKMNGESQLVIIANPVQMVNPINIVSFSSCTILILLVSIFTYSHSYLLSTFRKYYSLLSAGHNGLMTSTEMTCPHQSGDADPAVSMPPIGDAPPTENFSCGRDASENLMPTIVEEIFPPNGDALVLGVALLNHLKDAGTKPMPILIEDSSEPADAGLLLANKVWSPCTSDRPDLSSTIMCGDVEENPGPEEVVNKTPYEVVLPSLDRLSPCDFLGLNFNMSYGQLVNEGDPMRVLIHPLGLRGGWGYEQYQCTNVDKRQFPSPTHGVVQIKVMLIQIFPPEIAHTVSRFLGVSLLHDTCDCVRVVGRYSAFSNYVNVGSPVPYGPYRQFNYPMALVMDPPVKRHRWEGEVSGWESCILRGLSETISIHCLQKSKSLLTQHGKFLKTCKLKINTYSRFHVEHPYLSGSVPDTIVNLFGSHDHLVRNVVSFLGSTDCDGLPLWMWPLFSREDPRLSYKCEGRKKKTVVVDRQPQAMKRKGVTFAPLPTEVAPRWVEKPKGPKAGGKHSKSQESSSKEPLVVDEEILPIPIETEKLGHFETTCLDSRTGNCVKMSVRYVDGYDPTLCCLVSALKHSQIIPLEAFEEALDSYSLGYLRTALAMSIYDLDHFLRYLKLRVKFHVLVIDEEQATMEYHQPVIGGDGEVVDSKVMLIPSGFASHWRVKFRSKSSLSDFSGFWEESGHAFLARDIAIRRHDCGKECNYGLDALDVSGYSIKEVDYESIFPSETIHMELREHANGDGLEPVRECGTPCTLNIDDIDEDVVPCGSNSDRRESVDIDGEMSVFESCIEPFPEIRVVVADNSPASKSAFKSFPCIRTSHEYAPTVNGFCSSSAIIRHLPGPAIIHRLYIPVRIKEGGVQGDAPTIPHYEEPKELIKVAEEVRSAVSGGAQDYVVVDTIKRFIGISRDLRVAIFPNDEEEIIGMFLASVGSGSSLGIEEREDDETYEYILSYIKEQDIGPKFYSTPMLCCFSRESCSLSHSYEKRQRLRPYHIISNPQCVMPLPGFSTQRTSKDVDTSDPYLNKVSDIRRKHGWSPLTEANCPRNSQHFVYRTIATYYARESASVEVDTFYRVRKVSHDRHSSKLGKYRGITLYTAHPHPLSDRLCPFIELPSSGISYIGDEETEDVPPDHIWGDYHCDVGGLSLNVQLDTPWFTVGLGDRKWWYVAPSTLDQLCTLCPNGSPRRRVSFIGCGPTRPDTLFNIPHRYWGSGVDGNPDYSIFVINNHSEFPLDEVGRHLASTTSDGTRLNPNLGYDHDASIVKAPVVVGEVAYTFQKTGISIKFDGRDYDEMIAVRICASTVRKSRKALLAQDRTCPEVEAATSESVDMVRFRGRDDVPPIPLRTHQACMRLIVGNAVSDGFRSMVATILVTPTAAAPNHSLPPIAIIAWADYYSMVHARFHTALNMKVEAGKRSKGVSTLVNSWPSGERRCNNCRLFAPVKYSWRKGLCERCFYLEKTGYVHHPISAQYSDLTFPVCLPQVVTPLPGPTKIAPIVAVAKVKVLRDGGSYGCKPNSSKFKTLGFSRASKMRATPTGGPYLFGLGFGTRSGCFSKDPVNEDIALRYRIFSKPENGPEPGIFDAALRFIEDNKWFTGAAYPTKKMAFCSEKDLDNAGIFGAERTFVLRSLETLQMSMSEEGETWISTFPPSRRLVYLDVLKKDCSDLQNSPVLFDFFLKQELSCCGTRWGNLEQSPANPRVICSPSVSSHILMGPHLRPLTEALHTEWGIGSNITYAGGLTPAELNEWLASISSPNTMQFCRPGCLAIENDFAKFDCTYSIDALNFAKAVYKIKGFDVDGLGLSKVWDSWGKPTGYTRSGRKVNGPCMNASGRDDTALLNAMLNGIVQYMSYYVVLTGKQAWEDQDSTTVRWFGENFKVIVLGDDSLTLVPELTMTGQRWDIDQVTRQIDRFGFEARDVKVRHRPCECVFLGNRPYPGRARIDNYATVRALWGPTIGRRAVRLSYMMNYDRSKDGYAWLRGVCVASEKSFNHVPILNDIVQTLLSINLTKQCTPHSVQQHKLVMTMEESREDPICREMLQHVYGISLTDRERIRYKLGKVSKLPSILIDESLEAAILMDI